MQIVEREALPQIMLARYYSASSGRFLSVDPGNDTDPLNPQSWNKFAYVRNNPINSTDPTGMVDNATTKYDFREETRPVAQQSEGPKASSSPTQMPSLEQAAKQTSETAGHVANIALGVAALGSVIAAPEIVVPALGLAGSAGIVSTGGDFVAAAANRSSENLGQAAGDIVAIGTGAKMANMMGSVEKGMTSLGRQLSDTAIEGASIPVTSAVGLAASAIINSGRAPSGVRPIHPAEDPSVPIR